MIWASAVQPVGSMDPMTGIGLDWTLWTIIKCSHLDWALHGLSWPLHARIRPWGPTQSCMLALGSRTLSWDWGPILPSPGPACWDWTLHSFFLTPCSGIRVLHTGIGALCSLHLVLLAGIRALCRLHLALHSGIRAYTWSGAQDHRAWGPKCHGSGDWIWGVD